jgi:hypothetical protein
MKIYPRVEKNDIKHRLAGLPPQESLLRRVALVLAFVSVFAFVLKILFF